VSGNTGVSPFLTLLILGIVEISNPTLLNMGPTMEAVLASWYSIAVLGILTLIEIIGKCIPVVDEFIDSIEVFIVPIISVLGTLGVAGVLDLINVTTDDDELVSGGMMEGERYLQEEVDNDKTVGDAFLVTWKVVLVVLGIGLSLLIHFFKMIIRISGLVCCCGCCQPCITVVEMTAVCLGVVFAIFIEPIAIVTCLLLLIAAIYTIRIKFCKKEDDQDGNENPQSSTTTTTTTAATTTPKNDSSAGKDNGSTVAIPVPNSNFTEADPENPPRPPSAPMEESASFSNMIPIPPPPATNPNYDANNNIDNGETPVAIAVPISPEDTKESIPTGNATIYG
jgi:hypothetical protein